MKLFPYLVTSVLCSTVLASSVFAQRTGGTSDGGSSTPGSSSASASPSSTSPAPVEPKKKDEPGTTEAVGKSGGPVSPANLPARTKRDKPKPPAEPLPEGLTVQPPQPGISPVSGLPTAELPAISPGTQPLGPKSQPATPAPGTPIIGTPVMATPVTGTSVPDKTRPTLDATRTTATHLPPGAALPTEPRAPVSVPSAPPIAHPEMVPPSPINERGERWVGGHHSWSEGKWQWVEGGWQRPPAADAEWIAGHYDATAKRWTEGYWGTQAAATPATEPKPVK
ncbi:hypothetical protein [Horticoccus sp. 23ND18S-11]|uniref:hypothetical protein n=1 Tax=Horticoccus sp. 23ND18S-11 TaxID=3391832 RepID=UPI0039C9DA52